MAEGTQIKFILMETVDQESNTNGLKTIDDAEAMKARLLKIRFNTEHKGSLHWRILINEHEFLADNITIKVPTFNTTDTLPDGRMKYHFSCYYNDLQWIGTNLIVT